MSLVNIAQLVGGAVAVLALLEGGRGLFRRTIARRYDRYARLRRLGTGAQLSFFAAVLGEPPAMRRTQQLEIEEYDQQRGTMVPTSKSFSESFFIEPDHYVQTLSDEDDTVVAFSVTARARRFRPPLSAPLALGLRGRLQLWRLYRRWPRPLLQVTLNRTRFADADRTSWREDEDEQPVRIRAWMGARAWSYSEVHHYGNPGLYQTFILTASSAANAKSVDYEALHAIAATLGDEFDDGTASLSDEGRRFRRHSVVTTYTVLGPSMQLEAYSRRLNFGPHGDEVRTVP